MLFFYLFTYDSFLVVGPCEFYMISCYIFIVSFKSVSFSSVAQLSYSETTGIFGGLLLNIVRAGPEPPVEEGYLLLLRILPDIL